MKFLLRLLPAVLIFILTLGCSPNPPLTPSPTVEISPPLTETLLPESPDTFRTPTLSPDPNLALTLTPPATEETAKPPILVIITPDGLWKIWSNGIGLYKVSDDHIIAPQNTSAMPAPGGTYAAYITGDSRLRDLTLKIIHVERGLVYSIPLALPEYAIQQDAVQGDPDVEAARAVVERTSFAWSPNGSQLAFLGMREGPSSDVYTFSMVDFWVFTEEQANRGVQTIRWTDGPSQGISPTWSPDGRYILHAGVNTLGTGAGYDMAGVWAVDTQTGEVLDVYKPENSGAEIFVGWQDEDTFLVHSWTPVCGNERLRMVDILTGKTRMIWEGAFNGVAFTRVEGNGALLVSVDQYSAECKTRAGPGLFLLFGPEYIGMSTMVSEEAFLPVWSPEGRMFFARTAENVYGIELNDDVIIIRPLDAPFPGLPSVSDWWAARLVWASQAGVWVGALDAPPVQIFSSPASLPMISPNGKTVFFIAEEGLFVAHAPDFTPQLVGEGLLGTGAFWVKP